MQLQDQANEDDGNTFITNMVADSSPKFATKDANVLPDIDQSSRKIHSNVKTPVQNSFNQN
mgnify:CR=1 FL=1